MVVDRAQVSVGGFSPLPQRRNFGLLKIFLGGLPGRLVVPEKVAFLTNLIYLISFDIMEPIKTLTLHLFTTV